MYSPSQAKQKMKKKWIRILFGAIGGLFVLLLIAFYTLVGLYLNPKSDEEVSEALTTAQAEADLEILDFKDHKLRKISMQKEADPSLPNMIFVHGSPGSALDFKRYLTDPALNEVANLFAFDRIGYNPSNKGEVLSSMEEEVEQLNLIMAGMDEKNSIVVGYSYGGTLVMASPNDFKRKVALAASVRGDLEPMFALMKLYDFTLTRALIPPVLRGATREKLRHKKELMHRETMWTKSKSPVLAIHGDQDWIVPYENSIYLQGLFRERKFELIRIDQGDHALIWNKYDLIQNALLDVLRKD